MSKGNSWEIPAGDYQTYDVIVTNGSGSALSGLTGSEPLRAEVWEGLQLAPIANVLSPTWTGGNPSTATTCVVVNGATTAALTAQWYRVRLEIQLSGNWAPYYYGWLHVLPIPGSGVESPTYGTLQDMQDKAGEWLNRLQQETTETNFLAERARARSWLDDIIVSRSRIFALRFDLSYALYYSAFPFGPVESPDTVMQGYLASNFLMITDRTREIVSYKALAYVCEKKIGFDEDSERYRKLAAWYHTRANNAVRAYRCTLDINSDGLPDIAFNLGVISTR